MSELVSVNDDGWYSGNNIATLADVSADSRTVKINWSLVESNPSNPYAALMLAVRDGTWLPLETEKDNENG